MSQEKRGARRLVATVKATVAEGGRCANDRGRMDETWGLSGFREKREALVDIQKSELVNEYYK